VERPRKEERRNSESEKRHYFRQKGNAPFLRSRRRNRGGERLPFGGKERGKGRLWLPKEKDNPTRDPSKEKEEKRHVKKEEKD